MSGGGGNTTTTTKSSPWEGQQPYLKFQFQQARDLYDKGGPSYFPGTTLAPTDPATTEALALQQRRAENGSPLTNAAQNTYLDTINGTYLDPNSNPYLDQTFEKAAGEGRSLLDAQFSGAGRYGSGAHQGSLANLYSDLGNQIYGGNYQAERARQLNAANTAPQLAATDYQDIGALGQVGAERQNLAQQDINDQIQRYNYEQNLPYNTLANYASLVGGNYGSSQTTTQPYYGSSPLGTGLGGLLGAGIGYALAPATGGLSAAAPYLLGGAVGGGLLGGGIFR